MESSSLEADIAEIALIIFPGFTYEPLRPEGWASTASSMFGKIYLTRAVLNKMINTTPGRWPWMLRSYRRRSEILTRRLWITSRRRRWQTLSSA
jgi:hypothetical protein